MIESFKTALSNLPKGMALVITGPQGSGKTRLAQDLATVHGAYAIGYDGLTSPRELGRIAMAGVIKTYISEGLPKTADEKAFLKSLLSSKEILFPGQTRPLSTEKLPNFIFLTQDPQPLKHLGDQRFHVIDLSTVETKGAKA